MKNLPLVSIIIPAYNASNYLAEAIDSALAQTYPNVEIIVVNDGSKDNGATAKVAAEYGDKIKYIEKENGGSSSAINCGIRSMKGDWFSWLSHDDLYYPQKLEKQFAYIESLNLSGNELFNNVFFSACELIDGNGHLISRSSESSIAQMHSMVRNLKGSEYAVAQPRTFNFHGCSCLIPRSAFEKVGYFDEKLRILNDVEMWFRLYSNGYNLNYVPEVLVKGRVHSKQVSHSIGYSPDNPENDMLWKRRIDWISENFPNEYMLFYLIGKNAYLSYRPKDGDRAFEIAASLLPNKKFSLFVEKNFYNLNALARSFAKKIYMKIKS